MTDLIVREDVKLKIDSDVQTEEQLNVEVVENSSLVVELVGNNKLNLGIELKVNSDVKFSLLLLNNNQQEVVIKDNYYFEADSDSNIAYSQLNNADINVDSNYNLMQQGANLRVLTATISQNKKKFNQNTNHLAGFTSAHIDNYGVILADGEGDYVVKNTINKGFRGCQTHQTSKLLNYDKSSKGTVLPILVIDNNDVAASHACTLGQPDQNQIYYLQTRGLSHQQALQLITVGYLMPITQIIDDQQINDILKEEIETKVNGTCLK